MATQLQYETPYNPLAPRINIFKENQRLFPIAYIKASPEETLKNLISEYYVVNYLGVRIPSKSFGDNINEGLVILPIPEISGIEGKLENLKNNIWFEKAKHSFTKNELNLLGKQLKEQFDLHLGWERGKISEENIQNYLTIFKNIDYKISSKDLYKIIARHEKLEIERIKRHKKYVEQENRRNSNFWKYKDIPMGASV